MGDHVYAPKKKNPDYDSVNASVTFFDGKLEGKRFCAE
jgi:hypothetical protein